MMKSAGHEVLCWWFVGLHLCQGPFQVQLEDLGQTFGRTREELIALALQLLIILLAIRRDLGYGEGAEQHT